MAGSDHIRSHLQSTFQKGIELYLPVAQNVRIRCTALFIFIEHIVHYPLPVFFAQVYEVKRNAYLPCHHLRHKTVLLPFTVAMKSR